MILTVLLGCGSAARAPAPPAAGSACPAVALPPPSERPQHVVQRRHDGAVLGVQFSPSGRRLATIGNEGTLRVWDVAARTELWRQSLGETVTFAVWDDEDHLLAGFADAERGAAFVVDARGARKLAQAFRHAVRVDGIPGVRWAASVCTGERGIALLDRSGAELVRLVDPNRPADVGCIETFAVDGMSIAGAYQRGRAARWTVPSTLAKDARIRPLQATKLGRRETTASVLIPGGDLLLAAQDAKGFVLGSVATDEAFGREFDLPLAAELAWRSGEANPGRWINELALTPDGHTVIVAAGAYLYGFDLQTRRQIFREASAARMTASDASGWVMRSSYWHCHGYYCSADVSRDHRLLAVGTQRGRVHLYDGKTRRWLGELGTSTFRAEQLMFAGEDTLAAFGGGTLSVWSLRRARPIIALEPMWWASRVAVERDRIIAFGPAADPRCGVGRGAVRYEILNEPAPRSPDVDADPHRTIVSRCVLAANDQHRDALDDVMVSRDLAVVTRYENSTANRTGIVKRSRVIDLAKGGEVALDEIPAEENHMVAGKRRRLSPDGRWAFDVVTAPIKPEVAVWDATTGALLRRLTVRRATAGVNWATNTAFMAPGSDRIAVGDHAVVDVYGLPAFDLISGGVAVSDLAKHGFGPGTIAHAHAMASEETALRATSRGGVLASSEDDGSIRVADARGERVRLVMFDDAEWEIVTPAGAYTGSFEVAARVGWRFAQPDEVFGSSQFASRFEQPDLVARRLRGEPVEIEAAVRRPPRVRAAMEGGKLVVEYESTTRVDRIGVSVEGRLVISEHVCAASGRVELAPPLAAGNNRISVVAFDSEGFASNAATLDVAGPPSQRAPRLRMLTVGVGTYPKLAADRQLPGASRDATALVEAFTRATTSGAPFREVGSDVLVDARATPAAILAALDRLAAIAPEDVAIVMLSGHGAEAADGRMVFLTSGASLDEATWKDHGLDWSAIRDRLARVRGRVLLLLDACHSGGITRDRVVQNDRLASELIAQGRTGAIVFAASKGNQVAFEAQRAKALRPVARPPRAVHPDDATARGIFAGAIIEALGDPAADLDGDGVLQFGELVTFVTSTVDDRTGGHQTPWLVRREVFGDFALATTRRGR